MTEPVVYAVVRIDVDSPRLLGIFATDELAEAWIAKESSFAIHAYEVQNSLD